MRYVIKHPTLGYFSGVAIVGSAASVEVNERNEQVLRQRPVIKPEFVTDWRQAAKHETKEDCEHVMQVHPHKSQERNVYAPTGFLDDAAAFADCTIEVVPYFNG